MTERKLQVIIISYKQNVTRINNQKSKLQQYFTDTLMVPTLLLQISNRQIKITGKQLSNKVWFKQRAG